MSFHGFSHSTRSTQLEEVKAARHSCTAYVLQIFALELRAQEKNSNFSSTKMKELLDLLFSPNGGGDNDTLWGNNQSSPGNMPVMTVLKMAVNLPVLTLPSIASPLIIRCLQAATVPYSVSRGARTAAAGIIENVYSGLLS